MTNYPNSDLSKAAKINLDLRAGEELSLAATKTYTSQLTNLAILSSEIDQNEGFIEELNQLPKFVEEVFHNET